MKSITTKDGVTYEVVGEKFNYYNWECFRLKSDKNGYLGDLVLGVSENNWFGCFSSRDIYTRWWGSFAANSDFKVNDSDVFNLFKEEEKMSYFDEKFTEKKNNLMPNEDHVREILDLVVDKWDGGKEVCIHDHHGDTKNWHEKYTQKSIYETVSQLNESDFIREVSYSGDGFLWVKFHTNN